MCPFLRLRFCVFSGGGWVLGFPCTCRNILECYVGRRIFVESFFYFFFVDFSTDIDLGGCSGSDADGIDGESGNGYDGDESCVEC